MLDHFTIFTRNGVVLWSKTFTPAINQANHPVDALIRSAFIEERTADERFDVDAYTMRWSLANDFDLVFVVVYQRILQLSYIPELLDTVKRLFLSMFAPFVRAIVALLRPGHAAASSTTAALTAKLRREFAERLREWDDVFLQTLRKLERAAAGASSRHARRGIAGVGVVGGDGSSEAARYPLDENRDAANASAAQGSEDAPEKEGRNDGDEIARNVEALKARLKAADGGGSPGGGRRGPSGGGGRGKKGKGGKGAGGGGGGTETPGTSGTDTPTAAASAGTPSKKKPPPAKEMRKWDANGMAIDVAGGGAMDELDFSGGGVAQGTKKKPKKPSAGGGGGGGGGGEGANGKTRRNGDGDDAGGDLAGWVDERSMGRRGEDGTYEIADVDDGEDEDDDEEADDEDRAAGSAATESTNGGTSASSAGLLSRFGSLVGGPAGGAATGGGGILSRLTGGRALMREELAPALSAMQAHLQSKNVASDVAARLCDSVAQRLAGRRLGSFGSVRREVRAALEEAITRVLTPTTSTDLLVEIATKRQRFASRQQQQQQLGGGGAPGASASSSLPEPYSIAFVGVNGVGKSTNLSKVCFWLLQNKLRVLVAACDTFRSGAVEQLRVHVRNLGKLEVEGRRVDEWRDDEGGGARVELYERGYGKDAAGIAKEALAYARRGGFDVVLIDTAGRMQDNEPLMRALAKLVSVNAPDRVVFVGEALVGNEAVDQLTRFDRSLRDFSGVSRPRGLDGMLLTKFDTIDDKVGATLTACAVTGLPIYFVGVGQTYTDLRQLRVRHVVSALMRD